MNLLKSILHNAGVTAVSFAVAFLGERLDSVLGISGFRGATAAITGGVLLLVGFLLRVWATFAFYERRMNVISLVPQKKLITTGAYRISRNPLYLGGNVFMFLGAALVLGSPSGIVLTALNVVLVDRWIRREEKQLERDFGEEWIRYKNQVRRWIQF